LSKAVAKRIFSVSAASMLPLAAFSKWADDFTVAYDLIFVNEFKMWCDSKI
jgi:hypothetical protein